MNRPTPGPSQEGNSQACLDIDSPPPEGLGVGRFMESLLSFLRMHWDHEPPPPFGHPLPLGGGEGGVRGIHGEGDEGFSEITGLIGW